MHAPPASQWRRLAADLGGRPCGPRLCPSVTHSSPFAALALPLCRVRCRVSGQAAGVPPHTVELGSRHRDMAGPVHGGLAPPALPAWLPGRHCAQPAWQGCGDGRWVGSAAALVLVTTWWAHERLFEHRSAASAAPDGARARRERDIAVCGLVVTGFSPLRPGVARQIAQLSPARASGASGRARP